MPWAAGEDESDVFSDIDRAIGEDVDIRIEFKDAQIFRAEGKNKKEKQSKTAENPG
jgi:hypothetical protein